MNMGMFGAQLRQALAVGLKEAVLARLAGPQNDLTKEVAKYLNDEWVHIMAFSGVR